MVRGPEEDVWFPYDVLETPGEGVRGVRTSCAAIRRLRRAAALACTASNCAVPYLHDKFGVFPRLLRAPWITSKH